MFLGPESKASYYLGIKDIKIGELRPHPAETGGLYFPVLQEAAFERSLLVFIYGWADIIGHWWPGILSVVKLTIPECPFTVSYTHLTLPTTIELCRSRWSPYH